MFENLPGIAGMLAVLLCVWMAVRRMPSAGPVMWTAFAIRALLVFIAFYAFPNHGLYDDSVDFQRYAVEWSGQQPTYQFPGDYFISAVISVLYRLFGVTSLLAQSLSLFFGTGTVLLTWLLAREFWGERHATAAAWAVALFPTMVIYSAFIYREAYDCFFLMLALYGMVRWVRRQELAMLLLAFAGFGAATLYHGGIGIGAFMFLILLILQGLGIVLRSGHGGIVRGSAGVAIVVSVVLLYTFFVGTLALPKVGPATNALNFDLIISHIERLRHCSSGYPGFVVPREPIDLAWKAPLLAAYYLFSPFLWDIKAGWHVAGFVDGVLYLSLTIMLVMNGRAILAEKGAAWILLVVAAVVFVYSFGVGNFGTAIRHRTMVAAPLISLAAPWLSVLLTLARNGYYGR